RQGSSLSARAARQRHRARARAPGQRDARALEEIRHDRRRAHERRGAGFRARLLPSRLRELAGLLGTLFACFPRMVTLPAELATSGDIPEICECMSIVPRTIGADIGVSKAAAVMREADIRHLPVLREGKLVGIVSERDIQVARAFPGPGELTVEDVM